MRLGKDVRKAGREGPAPLGIHLEDGHDLARPHTVIRQQVRANVFGQTGACKGVEPLLGWIPEPDTMRPAGEHGQFFGLCLKAAHNAIDHDLRHPPVCGELPARDGYEAARRFEDLVFARDIRCAFSRHVDQRPDAGIA